MDESSWSLGTVGSTFSLPSHASPRPSINELVTHLRSSIINLEERIHIHHDPERTSGEVSPKSPNPTESSNFGPVFADGIAPSRRPQSSHGELTAQKDLYHGFGKALASAVTRALATHRFDIVRDSVNGEQTDYLMQPPPRTMADSRNVLTVRTRSIHEVTCHAAAQLATVGRHPTLNSQGSAHRSPGSFRDVGWRGNDKEPEHAPQNNPYCLSSHVSMHVFTTRSLRHRQLHVPNGTLSQLHPLGFPAHMPWAAVHERRQK
jgi:hypothetical protein